MLPVSWNQAWSKHAAIPLFVAAYVALDWASYISPLHQLNLTPWNPAPALGLLLLLRRGRAAAPALFAAIVGGDIFVRGMPGGLATTLVLGGILTAGYTILAHVLGRRFPDGGLFTDRAGLLAWTLIVLLASLANSLVFVSVLLAAGLLSAVEWREALLRFWIGDGVGIFVTLPLLWWLQDTAHRRLFRASVARWETAGHVALTAAALWVTFVLGAEANYRYFYVLFLPLVWAASRQGLAGAVLSAALLQMGMLLVAAILSEPEQVSVFEVQMRAFLLALVGFLIGVAVDDHRRAAADLRHSLRLAAAGEMAAALAHELNQPLTALSAYGAACERLIGRDGGDAQLREVIQRMVGEAGRAAEVVRRLRDFFRSGTTRLESCSVTGLVASVTSHFLDQAAERGIAFSVGDIPAAARLHADRLQLEVVLRNLLANAFEAVAERPDRPSRVAINAQLETGGRIAVTVEDSGPGVSPLTAGLLFEPFASTKSSGLGLGLAISRAIVEAHGGSLTAELGDHGRFRLLLPLEN